jgi:L-amino acid N-acyltransferase YncA
MQIRDSTDQDVVAVQAIYGYHVQHGLGTFETDSPELAEIRRRWTQITADGFPFLVAASADRVIGYAYANHFRTRPAYRNTVEDSIYVAPDALGRGVGRQLLSALIERCAALNLRQMLALIGDSANLGSIRVHRACGFEHSGVLRSVGRKFDRWVDVVVMQRSLGIGDSADPHQ